MCRYYKVPALASYTSPSRRVILIGDAAHALPPTGGQGAAMAFEDAATLARALALSFTSDSRAVNQSVKTSSEDQQSLFNGEYISKWQAHRQERIAKIAAFTAKGGDMRKHTSSTLQQVLKEWMTWLYFWYIGTEGGMAWIYKYKTDDD